MISHPFKVLSFSDQSCVDLASNIENRNTLTWKTKLPVSEAFVELRFEPKKLRGITISNTLSPEIQIALYNKDSSKDILDYVLIVDRHNILDSNSTIQYSKEPKLTKFNIPEKLVSP